MENMTKNFTITQTDNHFIVNLYEAGEHLVSLQFADMQAAELAGEAFMVEYDNYIDEDLFEE